MQSMSKGAGGGGGLYGKLFKQLSSYNGRDLPSFKGVIGRAVDRAVRGKNGKPTLNVRERGELKSKLDKALNK